jgi:hypothetical protein
MTSIVEELTIWVKNNALSLRENGIKLHIGIPEPESEFAWKASLGLEHDGVLVSYTVWERAGFETELLVMNASKETIVMDDATPENAEVVASDLDNAVRLLLDKTYATARPDSKLTIY